jgi:hypothetical protein
MHEDANDGSSVVIDDSEDARNNLEAAEMDVDEKSDRDDVEGKPGIGKYADIDMKE